MTGAFSRMVAARADAILEACVAADRPDLAADFIDKGLSVAEAKAELARIGDKGKPPAATPKPEDERQVAETAARNAVPGKGGLLPWAEVLANLDAPEPGAHTVPQPTPSIAASWDRAIAIASGKVTK